MAFVLGCICLYILFAFLFLFVCVLFRCQPHCIMAFRSVPVPAPRSFHFAAPLVCEPSVPSSDAAVAAAATAAPHLVCLDGFNENNVEHWFNSHTWQFHNNKVTKSADKYSLARAKLRNEKVTQCFIGIILLKQRVEFACVRVHDGPGQFGTAREYLSADFVTLLL